MTTSEMTTADTRLWQTPKSRFRLDLDLDAEPVAVQIAGSDAHQLAVAAVACVKRGAQIIDINMGCPAKKVCKKHAGSALLKDENLVAARFERLAQPIQLVLDLVRRDPGGVALGLVESPQIDFAQGNAPGHDLTSERSQRTNSCTNANPS